MKKKQSEVDWQSFNNLWISSIDLEVVLRSLREDNNPLYYEVRRCYSKIVFTANKISGGSHPDLTDKWSGVDL